MSEIGDSLKASLSSATKWAGGISGHLKNEANTISDVLEKVPSAVWDEVHNDLATGFKGHADRGISAGIGLAFGAGALLLGRRAPGFTSALGESKVSKLMAAGGLATEGYAVVSGAANLLTDGWNAGTNEQQQKLADKFSKSAGANLAPIVETAAAGGIGALAVDRALAYSPKFNVATFESLTEKRDYLYRGKFQADRNKLFTRAGSFSLSSDVTLGANRVNMNALTSQLENAPVSPLKRMFYSGDSNVEVVREINLGEGKVSIPQRGTPWGSQMTSLPEGLTDHNHHELTGILISGEDAAFAKGLNIVRSGDYRGYYIGQRENLSGVLKKGAGIEAADYKPVLPALNELVVNDKAKRAFLLQSSSMEQDPATRRWNWHPEPQYVDYDSAKAMLNNVDVTSSGAEKAFKSLPRISSEPHQDDIKAITPLTASTSYERKLKLAGTRQ